MTHNLNMPSTRIVAAIAAFHVVALIYFLTFLGYYGYLPQPFFHDAYDTFMDFYNTNFWAHSDGRYTVWNSVYPIFSFFVAEIISPSECYLVEATDARDCDHISLYVLLAVSLFAAYLNAKLFSENRVVRVLCFIAIVLSLPFLWAIERGNYVLLTYAFLVFAAYSKNHIAEGLFLACAINLKPYLLPLVGYALLSRKYRLLGWCFIWGLVVNVVGILYLAEPHFLLLFSNMALLGDTEVFGIFTRLTYAFSASSFIWFTKLPRSEAILELLRLEYILFMARIIEWILIGLVLYVAYRLIKLRGELDQGYIYYVTLVCIFSLTNNPGLHPLILFLPYLPAVYPLLTRRELIALLVLFSPIDTWFSDTHEELGRASWLTGELVAYNYGFMYGTVYRPVAMFLLLLFAAMRLTPSTVFGKYAAYLAPSSLAARTS